MNSLSHYNLVHEFIPMPQALKIPDAKAAVEYEWEILEKILAWQLTKVRNTKEVIEERCSFRVIAGSLSSQEFGVRALISKVQRQSCAPK